MDVLILNRYYYHYYSSAFFIILPGQSHGYGNPPFQVLVTEKSARNNLVPANSPAHGFTARELHKVAGQGSFYLHLFEDPATSVLFHSFLTLQKVHVTGAK